MKKACVLFVLFLATIFTAFAAELCEQQSTNKPAQGKSEVYVGAPARLTQRTSDVASVSNTTNSNKRAKSSIVSRIQFNSYGDPCGTSAEDIVFYRCSGSKRISAGLLFVSEYPAGVLLTRKDSFTSGIGFQFKFGKGR